MIHPEFRKIYSLRDILTNMQLDDSPSLLVKHEGKESSIQTSHVPSGHLLEVPGFAETQWRYLETTEEWIPVFRYAGEQEAILACVDIAQENEDERYAWITPKGFPREQHQSLTR